MAIQYPFELDVFQKEAVMHLERGESVFVAAHTSAGKTVVAEYAIALAAKHLTRAIYTSPIKTLSNQKFREFRKTFGEDDVGIMTGDVSINPEASCLILTTEILRSMLYKGADLIRDIEWVIFDEVHYLNDPDRGVVWEEVIIMLPAHINIILLSATVPNTREFADWVGRTKKQKIYVISTHKRPVPLQHFLWCKNKLWKVLDQNKRFLTSGFKDARMDGEKQYNTVSHKQGQMLAAGGGGGGRGGRGGKRGGRRGGRAGGGFRNFRSGRGGRGGGRGGQQQRNKNQWFAITNYLKTRELLPVAVFAFSKKRCEEAATSMIAMDLTTTQEKSEIHTFFDAAVSRLKGSDRRLPQVLRMKELLKRGVGVHHAGMLPILKEVVEMVFSRGLVKILFATETFAMGVNMPTRTVVFESTRKHDGVEFRDLLPGEYTQMAGRAGRRGLDSFGVVVIIARNDVVPEELGVRQMLLGKATRLESRFRLTYNMILSLFRQEDMKVEDMIKRSFSEFWQTKDAPEKKELLRKGAKKLAFIEKKSIDCVYHDDRAVEDYHDLASRLRDINTELAKEMMTSKKYTGKFLPPGRILLVSKNDIASTLAVVLKSGDPTAQLKANVDGHGGVSDRNLLTVLLLLPHSYSLPKRVQERMDRGEVSGVKMGDRYMITVLRPRDIHHVVDIKITVDPTGILIDGYQRKIQPTVQELENLVASYGHAQTQVEVSSSSSPLSTIDLYAHELPILDLAKSMSISNIELADELAIKDSISEALYNSEVHRCPNLSRHMKVMNKQAQLKYRVAQLKYALSDENVTLFADFNQRLTVLQELQYVDTDRTVHLKGRVACEINTCDSLILTELIFENALVDLEPAEIVALLSTMIFHGKSQAEPVLTDRLQDALESLKKVAMSLGNLQLKCGLDIVPSEYVRDNVNIAMVQVVYEWAKGKPFNEICELTDVLEGSIVRCITRLDEACRDVRNAARVVGDSKLYQVMTTASEIIKRDIVFAASLYVA